MSWTHFLSYKPETKRPGIERFRAVVHSGLRSMRSYDSRDLRRPLQDGAQLPTTVQPQTA